MSSVDTRQIPRDSLFLLSTLRLDGEERLNRIKVRNLSAGGMMAEGQVRVRRGTLVHIDLRNVGWVMGSVAWVQDNRFGVAFADEIDPKLVRQPIIWNTDDETPAYIRTHMRGVYGSSRNNLRKI